MPKHLRSRRVSSLVQSDIRAMTRACNAVGGVNMGQGICDVPAPDLVKEGAIAAIRDDISIYTRYDGLSALREAIAGKVSSFNGIDADPETEIVATIGASGALASTLMALFDPGDGLLLFEPYYGYHLNTALVAGLEPGFIPLEAPTFEVADEALEAAIRPNTRAIIVNTPTNPSGKVFTRDELDRIAAFCIRHDLLCITDEIYEYLVFDQPHISIATLPGMRERTVTISGYSKTFSITGWRIGYVCADRALAEPIGLVNDLYYVCAPAPLQMGVAHAIRNLGPDYYADMCEDYRRKRDQFCSLLDEIGLPPIVPDGAYYVLADISSLGATTARDAAMRLLEEGGVASVPGSAFFMDGRGDHLTRFCFAKKQEELDEACRRLVRWHRGRAS